MDIGQQEPKPDAACFPKDYWMIAVPEEFTPFAKSVWSYDNRRYFQLHNLDIFSRSIAGPPNWFQHFRPCDFGKLSSEHSTKLEKLFGNFQKTIDITYKVEFSRMMGTNLSTPKPRNTVLGISDDEGEEISVEGKLQFSEGSVELEDLTSQFGKLSLKNKRAQDRNDSKIDEKPWKHNPLYREQVEVNQNETENGKFSLSKAPECSPYQTEGNASVLGDVENRNNTSPTSRRDTSGYACRYVEKTIVNSKNESTFLYPDGQGFDKSTSLNNENKDVEKNSKAGVMEKERKLKVNSDSKHIPQLPDSLNEEEQCIEEVVIRNSEGDGDEQVMCVSLKSSQVSPFKSTTINPAPVNNAALLSDPEIGKHINSCAGLMVESDAGPDYNNRSQCLPAGNSNNQIFTTCADNDSKSDKQLKNTSECHNIKVLNQESLISQQNNGVSKCSSQKNCRTTDNQGPLKNVTVAHGLQKHSFKYSNQIAKSDNGCIHTSNVLNCVIDVSNQNTVTPPDNEYRVAQRVTNLSIDAVQKTLLDINNPSESIPFIDSSEISNENSSLKICKADGNMVDDKNVEPQESLLPSPTLTLAKENHLPGPFLQSISKNDQYHTTAPRAKNTIPSGKHSELNNLESEIKHSKFEFKRVPVRSCSYKEHYYYAACLEKTFYDRNNEDMASKSISNRPRSEHHTPKSIQRQFSLSCPAKEHSQSSFEDHSKQEMKFLTAVTGKHKTEPENRNDEPKFDKKPNLENRETNTVVSENPFQSHTIPSQGVSDKTGSKVTRQFTSENTSFQNLNNSVSENECHRETQRRINKSDNNVKRSNTEDIMTALGETDNKPVEESCSTKIEEFSVPRNTEDEHFTGKNKNNERGSNEKVLPQLKIKLQVGSTQPCTNEDLREDGKSDYSITNKDGILLKTDPRTNRIAPPQCIFENPCNQQSENTDVPSSDIQNTLEYHDLKGQSQDNNQNNDTPQKPFSKTSGMHNFMKGSTKLEPSNDDSFIHDTEKDKCLDRVTTKMTYSNPPPVTSTNASNFSNSTTGITDRSLQTSKTIRKQNLLLVTLEGDSGVQSIKLEGDSCAGNFSSKESKECKNISEDYFDVQGSQVLSPKIAREIIFPGKFHGRLCEDVSKHSSTTQTNKVLAADKILHCNTNLQNVKRFPVESCDKNHPLEEISRSSSEDESIKRKAPKSKTNYQHEYANQNKNIRSPCSAPCADNEFSQDFHKKHNDDTIKQHSTTNKNKFEPGRPSNMDKESTEQISEVTDKQKSETCKSVKEYSPKFQTCQQQSSFRSVVTDKVPVSAETVNRFVKGRTDEVNRIHTIKHESTVNPLMSEAPTIKINPESTKPFRTRNFLKEAGHSEDPLLEKLNEDARNRRDVIHKLKTYYQHMYITFKDIRSRFPVYSEISSYHLSDFFDLEVHTLDKTANTVRSDRNVYEVPPDSTCNRILVSAKPFFGKTTFCGISGYHWKTSSFPVSKYSLCLYFSLRELDLDIDLVQCILNYLQGILNKEFPIKTIGQSLKEISKSMLLLFDDLDEISKLGQQKFTNFLCSNSIFKNSTILVTSRPKMEREFLSKFDKHVHIKGFSSTHLLPKQQLQTAKKIPEVHEKFNYLSGISPLYQSYICSIVNLPGWTSESLYKVLVHIFKRISSGNTSLISNEVEDAFTKLGHLFLKALRLRKCTFEEDVLKKALGTGLENIKPFLIFYKELGNRTESNLWTVSSRIWLVFFATRYLKKLWSKLENLEERVNFINRELCCNSCVGDYVIGEGHKFSVYYVGLLPEIVLKLGIKNTLEDATIEMYYDTDRTEHCRAFDTTNLLLRVADQNLGIFDFELLDQNDENLSSVFERILIHLSVDGCCVDYFFYHNRKEQKNFLKFLVFDSDDQNNILCGVFKARTDNVIEGLYMDFSLSEIRCLNPCVNEVMSTYLKSWKMCDFCETSSCENYLFDLILSIAQSEPQFIVQISCTNDTKEVCGVFKRNVTCKVIRDHENKEAEISFSLLVPKNTRLVPTIKKYTLSDFETSEVEIRDDVKDCINSDSWISINFQPLNFQ